MSKDVRLNIVAFKAFALGAAVAGGCAVLLHCALHTLLARVALYVVLNAVFHMFEFVFTAAYNPGEVDDDSFILSDTDLHAVFVAALAEAALQLIYWRFSGVSLCIGLAIAIAGQACRSVSMRTAGVSFNHYVQKEHREHHTLVTSGVYHYCRHPSYFGYFWWFVGTQIVLQNWVVLLLGAYKLIGFFAARIEYEEDLLISFFGDEYRRYRRQTGVFIPFLEKFKAVY